MTDIAPCPRCHYGAGPQGAERYWESRWRDEKARNDALVKALEFIRDGYANQDVNHVDYRVKVYQVALDALAAVGGSRHD